MYSEEIKQAAEMINRYITAYIHNDISFDEALNKAYPYYIKICNAYINAKIESLADVKDLTIGDKAI